MTTARLRDLKTIDDVARACGVEADFILEYARSPNQSKYYEVIRLSKKGKRRQGEYRIVFAAAEERLSQLHRGISMLVNNSVDFGLHVQGFVKKRSTKSNAEQHLARRVLLHADIRGFFDAITTQHVKDAFVASGMSVELAHELAKVCTIDGLLRQGTRCAPSVANLVCLDMDRALLQLANSTDCVYTRYADDITFSGEAVPSDDAVRVILDSKGFELRDGRCTRQRKGRVQFVTGLSVADAGAPRLPRRLKRQLRLVMHFIEKYGLAGHYEWPKQVGEDSPVIWLDGILRYANSIEPELVSSWRQVLWQAMLDSKNTTDAPGV